MGVHTWGKRPEGPRAKNSHFYFILTSNFSNWCYKCKDVAADDVFVDADCESYENAAVYDVYDVRVYDVYRSNDF